MIESLLFPTNAKALIYPKMNVTFIRVAITPSKCILREYERQRNAKKADCFIIEN